MSDLFFWDLLYLKGDLSLEGYIYITVVAPIIFFIVIIGWHATRDYGPDMIHWVKKKIRGRK